MNYGPLYELKKSSQVSDIQWNYEFDFKNEKPVSCGSELLSLLETVIWDLVTEKVKNSQM